MKIISNTYDIMKWVHFAFQMHIVTQTHSAYRDHLLYKTWLI